MLLIYKTTAIRKGKDHWVQAISKFMSIWKIYSLLDSGQATRQFGSESIRNIMSSRNLRIWSIRLRESKRKSWMIRVCIKWLYWIRIAILNTNCYSPTSVDYDKVKTNYGSSSSIIIISKESLFFLSTKLSII